MRTGTGRREPYKPVTFSGVLFALDYSRALGSDIAAHLGVRLAEHEERDFDGGEQKIRPMVEVGGADCYVVASLDGGSALSANDKLCRLLFFVGALKQSGARRVIAVVPYLCYARKDRQSKARDPVTTRYVAQMFEAVGTDHVVTIDVHNLAAFQNATRCRSDHLEATQLFVQHVQRHLRGPAAQPLVVVSPDIGGVKRARRLQGRLEAVLGEAVGLAFVEKFRSGGSVSGRDAVFGDVEGSTAIVFDDLISSGGTMARVATSLKDRGAGAVHLAATHGVFTPEAARLLAAEEVTSVVVTDSVVPDRLTAGSSHDRLVVLPLGPLLGEAIDRIDSGGSLAELLHLDS